VGDVTLRDGATISYEIVGSGPPVVVCCGGPNTTYGYLVEDLATVARDFTLVFFDYRGSGRSSSADPATYTFEHLGDDVDELSGALGYEHVGVIAHSMGGLVALQFALRHPRSCSKLVLISTSPSGDAKRMAWPTMRVLGPARFAKTVYRALMFAVTWGWRRPSADKTLASFGIMATLQEGAARYRAAVRLRETFVDNENAPYLQKRAGSVDLIDRLERIRCPTLVIYGTRDAPFAAAAPYLLDSIPNVEELRIDGCGHHPLVEAHDRVVAKIRTFLHSTR
jgi:pimeloyl-ACP methyl ester carboxylesterase